MSRLQWDEETDLLVIGSGAAGMTAALVAALEGLDVVLCEKERRLGGTSAVSGGAIWIAGSTQAGRAGYDDTAERGREYLLNELGNYARRDLVDAFTASGPEMVDYLEARTDVVFDVVALPDYHDDTPGGVAAGRVLIPRAFDGRKLGADFARIAPPLKPMTVLGGMMVGFAEIPMMIRPFRSWMAFSTVSRNLLRYASDRLRHDRGTRLLNGNALVARLYAGLKAAKADVRTGTGMREIVVADGRAQGAVIGAPGHERRVRARRGVVLATGGPAHDAKLRQDLMGDFPHLYSIASPGADGDGLRAGLKAGGTVDRDVSSPAVWTPASVRKERDGSLTLFPYGYLDRGKPGAIAVNAAGSRFVNEANSYHDVVQAMYAQARPGEVPKAHLVCDADFIGRYGLGLIRPRDPTLRAHVRSGYVLKAATIEELAARIGVDPAGLARTVEAHNRYAQTGVDPEFGKGSTAFNRSNGDPSVKPNPNLKPIAKPPFYALPITPATLGISVGLKTDGDARVLDASGRPVEGLYACGNDMASVMRGFCPGGGVVLGPAMVFAYRAARHAAGAA